MITAGLELRNKSQYEEEKVSGTKASTEKPVTRLLVIGGPAEGKMLEETPFGFFNYPEMKPVKVYEFDPNVIPDLSSEVGFISHVYRVEKLMFKEANGKPYLKKIYLHSSLDSYTGMERLKAFLLEQFIKMELN